MTDQQPQAQSQQQSSIGLTAMPSRSSPGTSLASTPTPTPTQSTPTQTSPSTHVMPQQPAMPNPQQIRVQPQSATSRQLQGMVQMASGVQTQMSMTQSAAQNSTQVQAQTQTQMPVPQQQQLQQQQQQQQPPQQQQFLTTHPPGAVVRSALPQQLQLITPQSMPNANYIQQQQQQYLQQQFMLTQMGPNPAAVQGMGIPAMQQQSVTQQVSIGTIQQNRTTTGLVAQQAPPKSPGIVPVVASSNQGTPVKSSSCNIQGSTATTMTQVAKGSVASTKAVTAIPQQQVATNAVYGQKQLPLQRQGQPVVIGQLAINQGVPVVTSQAKSPTVSVAPGTATQVLNNPGALRFSNQTFVTNTGQLIGNQMLGLQNMQTMTFQPNIPLQSNQVLTSNATTIQPVYIRAAPPLTGQQGIVGNVQMVAPNKGANITSKGAQVKTVGTGKGVQQILPLPQPVRPTVAQGSLAKQQVQVQPSSISVQTSPTRQVQTGTGPMRQISRVQGVKSASRPQPPQVVQRRIAPQPAKPGMQNSSNPPMVVVQPKVQQIAPKAKKTASTSTSTSTSTTQVRHQSDTTRPTPHQAAQQANCTSGTAKNPQDVPSCDDSEKDDEDFEDDDDNNQDADEEDVGMEDESGRNKQGAGKKEWEATGPAERQQAVVRPQILTHIIEGFVIQEAREPFPVQRSSIMNEILGCKPVNSGRENDSDLDRDSAMDLGEGTNSETDSGDRPEDGKNGNSSHPDMGAKRLRCEFCGKDDYARRFKRSKRFCSMACAKRYNVGCSRHVRLFPSKNGAGGYVKKRKSVPGKRSWLRDQQGRVSTGPIQRTKEMQVNTTGIYAPTGEDTSTSSQPDTPPALPADDYPMGVYQEVAPFQPKVKDTHNSVLPSMALPPGELTSESERSTTPSGQPESSSSSSPPRLEREVAMDTGAGGDGQPSRENEEEEDPPVPKKHLREWNVQDVFDFIHNLPGCRPYADEFSRQEIDGQALMLLKEDHLMTAMNIKLGPALKICAKIKSLREDVA